jgi:hypothetical protein
MKKFIALLLALVMVMAFVACGGEQTPTTPSTPSTPSTAPSTQPSTQPSTEPSTAPSEPEVKVMTHAEYVAAPVDSPVVVETYVQGAQSWWQDSAIIYTQDQDGAYLLYKITCTKEQFDKLKVGTKIRVTGYKAEYKGQMEIIDGTFEIIDGSYVAEPVDLSDKLSADNIMDYQTMLFSAKSMTVEVIKDKDGKECAFLYNWDGSGQQGNDLYFNVSINGVTYNFCVESYLTGAETDVYKAVEALKVGDKIDVQGFLYWYDGINPHITAVTPAA